MDPEIRMAQRNGRDLFCPKCKKSLLVALQDETEVDYCQGCKGVWVDYIEEKTLFKMKSEVFTMDELRRLRKHFQNHFKHDPVRYVNCPVCGELMNRKVWGSYSGVIVDRCDKHGTWYDEGELAKVAEYVALGGVEYEKMKKPEQDLATVERELLNKINGLDKKIDSRFRLARLYSRMGL